MATVKIVDFLIDFTENFRGVFFNTDEILDFMQEVTYGDVYEDAATCEIMRVETLTIDEYIATGNADPEIVGEIILGREICSKLKRWDIEEILIKTGVL